MSIVNPQYQPGAVTNGHYLASDYRWYPVPTQPQVIVNNNSNTAATVLWTVGVLGTLLFGLLTMPLWIWFVPMMVAMSWLLIPVAFIAGGAVWGGILVERRWGMKSLLLSLGGVAAVAVIAAGVFIATR